MTGEAALETEKGTFKTAYDTLKGAWDQAENKRIADEETAELQLRDATW